MKDMRWAIKDSGGLSAVAARLGVTPQRLNNWIARGVPVEYAWELEIATEGRVTRSDLRPDDWDRIWPDLAGTASTSHPHVEKAA